MPTLRDVARRAGVAPITVSRVINNSGYYSEDARSKVEAAAAELGYVPNSLARSLRGLATKSLGLIVSDVTNPFFTVVARGVEDAANEAGFNVFLCNTDESEAKENEYLGALLQKQVDGILLVPSHSAVVPLTLVRRHEVALVILDRRVPSCPVDVVRCDSEDGAYRLINHLIELGHQRIGVLTGPSGVSTAEDRVAGYLRALSQANIEVDNRLIRFGSFSQESGSRMTRDLLQETNRPTAIFAANNFLAIGALRALAKEGLRVPEDMSVVAFDDLPSHLVITPFLTVAAQPAYEMGKQATELLLARLSGSAPAGFREIVLPTELIVRASSSIPSAS